MAKKTSKKPPRNGNKQKQKQKQTVIVNINNGKTRAKRQTKKPSVIRTPQYINTFPVFQQIEPSPPLIHNVPLAKQPVFEPVRTPTNSIGLQTFIPEIVKQKRQSKIPVPSRKIPFTPADEVVINLIDIYGVPDDKFQYDNTPVAQRTRPKLVLSDEEIQRRKDVRNEKARLKRLEQRLQG
jgi:hypothetical protein